MQPWYMLLSIHNKEINVYFYAKKKHNYMESANTAIFFDKEKVNNQRRHVYNSMYDVV